MNKYFLFLVLTTPLLCRSMNYAEEQKYAEQTELFKNLDHLPEFLKDPLRRHEFLIDLINLQDPNLNYIDEEIEQIGATPAGITMQTIQPRPLNHRMMPSHADRASVESIIATVKRNRTETLTSISNTPQNTAKYDRLCRLFHAYEKNLRYYENLLNNYYNKQLNPPLASSSGHPGARAQTRGGHRVNK